jgi:alpha-tubulin suppressor-like RCC1 family protein
VGTLLPHLPGVAEISGGYKHTCVRLITGALKCWGSCGYGQCGNGAAGAILWPDWVNGYEDGGAIQVDAGSYHSCAVTSGNGAQCWGYSRYGQLGNGVGDGSTDTFSTTPQDVSGLGSGVARICTGGYFSCALVTGGNVACWGQNNYAQLGLGSTTPSFYNTPQLVHNPSGSGPLTGIVDIDCGSSHACALTSGTEMLCWGANFYGNIGDDTATHPRVRPVFVVDSTGMSSHLSGIREIDLGWHQSCARVPGAQKCWGWNNFGQVGDGTNVDKYAPVWVLDGGGSPLPNPVQLGNGGRHSCSTVSGQVAFCWGRNEDGELGDGTSGAGNQRWFADIVLESIGPPVQLAQVLEVDGGGFHTCAAVGADAEMMCWGLNDGGQLGNGVMGTMEPLPIFSACMRP